jgi:cytosolic carboxypeptidase protein 5
VANVQQGETITFSMRNMNNQGRLYKMGLKPVYRLQEGRKPLSEWKRISGEVNWDYVEEGGGGPFFISWTYTFGPEECAEGVSTYFAFSYPFSFEEIQQ